MGVGRKPTFDACDNMKCGKINKEEEIKFKRCAACRSAMYCSRQCQSVDWRDAHRDVCESIRAARYRYRHLVLPPRERAFMRAFLNLDYLGDRYNTWLKQIIFMHEHPGEQYFVGFDYSEDGMLDIQVLPRASSPLQHMWRPSFPCSGGESYAEGGECNCT
ncbi:hypothetical protein C8R44DRAFT_792791 [Mycena epipterygia]|nr:hypothetical protein C8R44DRAFT_792791 [Mycena epipterygia]